MKNALLLIFSLFLTFASHASVQDSVGVDKKGSKYFVKHQMETGETLYALSRKYNVSVPEIKEANPGVNISDIGVGEIILVPLKNYKPATSAASSKSSGTVKIHKVEPKETLYALSKKYNVSVDELKKANPELAERGLQIGMDLVIPGATAAKSDPGKVENKTTTSTATKAAKTEPVPVKTAQVKEPEPKKAWAPKELPNDNESIEKIKESGIAELAPQKADAPDFYAFHKTAPVGTIILVVNQENDQNAYVRVIGSLQSPGSNSTLVQLSPKAMERIKANGKVKVNLSYFLP